MFVDSMTGSQLLNEYLKDLPEIQEKTLRFDESEYVGKYLQKRFKQQQVVITKMFKMSSGNRYIGVLIYTQTGMGKTKQWIWGSFHIGLMNTYKGTASITFYTDSKQALVYTPHFFKRYKERFSKVCDWRTRNKFDLAKSFEDIISIYVSRNIRVAWIETDTVFSDKTHIFAPIDDGVALLQWDDKKKVLQANTFVTMDMLNEKQTEMVNIAWAYLSLPAEEKKKFKLPDFIRGDESNENKQTDK